MSDHDVALSIIVDAIQFEMQRSGERSGPADAGGGLAVDDRVRIASAILTALTEQGFQVTRLRSEPR